MEAEWVILADHAEVINNKLYLMGGGWESLTVNALPAQHPCGVSVSFSVPWNETNRLHDIEIEVADEDGRSLVKIEGQIEVGRPPGIPLGHAQRVQMAANLGLTIERLGAYVVVARVEGQESRRVRFNVVAGPGLLQQQPAQGQGSAPS